MAADTLLVRRNQIHRHKPLAKVNLGVIEYCTNFLTKVLVTVGTTETTIGSLVAMVLTAVRAYDIITPTRLNEGLLAFFLSVEVSSH
jgi:hypothetical protein